MERSRSQSSKARDAESANEPLNNNRPGDDELAGGGNDRNDAARPSPASQVGRSETGGEIQDQSSTRRRPFGKGGQFPTNAMSRPNGRSQP